MSSSDRTFLCAGAAHWDIIARASVEVGPGGDVPGQVIRRPGGVAANVAMGLARRHFSVRLCAIVGQDDAGTSLAREMMATGVNCDALLVQSEATNTYVAIEDKDGELIAAVAENPDWQEAAGRFVDQAESALSGCSDLFVDATLPKDIILKLATLAADRGIGIIANPVSPVKATRLDVLMRREFDVCIVANLAEANALTGSSMRDALSAAKMLIDRGAGAALVTNGIESSALVTTTDAVTAMPSIVHGTRSVTGAGDALLAAFLAEHDRYAVPDTTLRAAINAATTHMKAT